MADTSKHPSLFSGGASKPGLAKKLKATYYGEDLMSFPEGMPGPGKPGDPDPKAKKQSKEDEEKQVVRIIGSGSGKILSSRIQGEEGKLYSEIKKEK